MIIRSGVVDHLIDVKTDIGWARDKLPEKAQTHFNDVRRARGATCGLRDSAERATALTYPVSKTLTYDIVIISATNVAEDQLSLGVKEARSIDSSVDVFVLSTGQHPNSYNFSREETLKHINVDHAEFSRLKERLTPRRNGVLSSFFGRLR